MSKSLGNYIGVTEPPEEIYGKTLSIPDEALETWYRLLLGTEPPAELGPRDAKRALARELVARFHGRGRGARRPSGSSTASTSRAQAPEEMPTVSWPADQPERAPAGAARERVRGLASDARRSLAQGGVKLDGETVGNGALDLPAADGRRQGPAARQAAVRARARGVESVAVHGGLLRLETPGNGHIVDITPGVASVVNTAGVDRGVVSVFATGSTVAVTTMEYEPGGVHDLQALLDRLIPSAGDYEHNRLNHDTNSHAHLRAAVIGPSETIPLVDGQLALGTWQQVVLIDFDDRPRRRTVTVQVLS